MATTTDTRQAKAAYCQHCGGWVVMATMPDAEIDAWSRREFAKCAKAGNNIKILPVAEAHVPGPCMGHKKGTLNLFDATTSC